MKILVFVNLILLVLVLVVNGSERPGKKHYCTKNQIHDVMKLACIDSMSQKRSFYYPNQHNLKKEEYNLWKKIFNINENSSISIPEMSFQLNLLNPQRNELKRQSDINNLLEFYNNRDYHKNLNQELTNDRLNDFLNYDTSMNYNDENSQFKPLRRFRRGIVEECCTNSCTVKDLNKFCPD